MSNISTDAAPLVDFALQRHVLPHSFLNLLSGVWLFGRGFLIDAYEMSPDQRLEQAPTVSDLADGSPFGIADQSLLVLRLPNAELYSLDPEGANKRLKDCRYFVTDHAGGFAIPYCWATDAEASHISHLFRVSDKDTLHLIATYDHAGPNDSPYARALGYEFYFPRVELRRIPHNGTSTATTVYFNGRDALQAADDWNNYLPLPNGNTNDGPTLDLPEPPTGLAGSGFQDQQGIHYPQPEALPLSVFQASESSSILGRPLQNTPDYAVAQVDPGNSTARHLGSSSTPARIQEPLPPAIPRVFQPSTSSDFSHMEQAAQVAAFFNPNPPHMTTAPTTAPITVISGWQLYQIMRVPIPDPTTAYILWFSGRFSVWIKQHNSDRAVCWHCHYDYSGQTSAPRTGRRLAQRGALKNISPWYIVRHLQAHFGLREFICPEPTCMRGFVTNQQMRRHVKKKHSETWEQLSKTT